MDKVPQASVIIPTCNRASCLSICLEALSALNTDPSTFEVVVVDNNSRDKTRSVVTGFADAHPNISVRYVVETAQGVSNARNCGLTEARAEVLFFLDDDSPPAPEWLNTLLASFADPSVGCAGGPSVLDFQGQAVPPWLRGDLQGLISGYALPYASPTAAVKWEQFPLACNLAIRRKALAHLEPFRRDLGRIGSTKLTGGETDLINRIQKAGWKIMYVPNAQVRHLVHPERLVKSYIYRIGHGLAASHIVLTSDPRWHILLRWVASDTWYATRRFFWLIVALVKRKPLWFDDYMRFWMVAMRIPLRVKSLLQNNSVAP